VCYVICVAWDVVVDEQQFSHENILNKPRFPSRIPPCKPRPPAAMQQNKLRLSRFYVEHITV
jgi:hypothetical protein